MNSFAWMKTLECYVKSGRTTWDLCGLYITKPGTTWQKKIPSRLLSSSILTNTSSVTVYLHEYCSQQGQLTDILRLAMRMDLSQLFMVSLTLACLPLSQSYRNGARQESCYNMLVMHERNVFGTITVVPPTTCGSPCQYQLSMIGRVSGEADLNTVEERNSTTYQCGQIYQCKWKQSLSIESS